MLHYLWAAGDHGELHGARGELLEDLVVQRVQLELLACDQALDDVRSVQINLQVPAGLLEEPFELELLRQAECVLVHLKRRRLEGPLEAETRVVHVAQHDLHRLRGRDAFHLQFEPISRDAVEARPSASFGHGRRGRRGLLLCGPCAALSDRVSPRSGGAIRKHAIHGIIHGLGIVAASRLHLRVPLLKIFAERRAQRRDDGPVR
mmetsp:Transcript_66772/g.186246  ORF Transcript_66772/g.186246 Transcript_66772/m.186246 type:complete len:205 (+) Transcript_66772:266-880(+)